MRRKVLQFYEHSFSLSSKHRMTYGHNPPHQIKAFVFAILRHTFIDNLPRHSLQNNIKAHRKFPSRKQSRLLSKSHEKTIFPILDIYFPLESSITYSLNSPHSFSLKISLKEVIISLKEMKISLTRSDNIPLYKLLHLGHYSHFYLTLRILLCHSHEAKIPLEGKVTL